MLTVSGTKGILMVDLEYFLETLRAKIVLMNLHVENVTSNLSIMPING